MRSTRSASQDSRSSSSARKHWDKMKKGTASTHRPSRRKKRCSLMRAARRELVSYHPCIGPVSLARELVINPTFDPYQTRLCLVKKWDPDPDIPLRVRSPNLANTEHLPFSLRRPVGESVGTRIPPFHFNSFSPPSTFPDLPALGF